MKTVGVQLLNVNAAVVYRNIMDGNHFQLERHQADKIRFLPWARTTIIYRTDPLDNQGNISTNLGFSSIGVAE